MNTKKKILFLVTQSEFGGAQRFIYTLLSRSLFTPKTTPLDAGVKGRCNGVLRAPKILVGAGPEGDDKNGLLFTLEKIGIKTRHLKYLRRSINPFFDFLALLEIYKIIKKEKPDILFLCSSKAGFLGSLAARRYTQIISEQSSEHADIRRTVFISVLPKAQNQRLSARPKVIYRIGGWTFNDPWPKWKKRIYLWLEKETAKFKDIIVNNAESDTGQAERLGIKPKKQILTIYNGVDVSKLEFLSKKEAREFLQLKESDFVVGTIANDYPAKGLNYLKEAEDILKDKNVKFIIIGKGNRFIPEAYRYLKAFDIFVLPSVKEGFPWVILEAMAAEIPVIATKVGALPEIIENNKTGILIESRNAEELAKAIKNLISNEGLRKKLSEEAIKIVEEKFNLEKMITKFEELFEK